MVIACGLASGPTPSGHSVLTPLRVLNPNASASSAMEPGMPEPAAVKADIPYIDAKPILELLRENRLPAETKPILGPRGEELLPAELRAKTSDELESAWPGWVSRQDAQIRARVERGDEDSIVNFLRFGVTFTKLPRSTNRDIPLPREIVTGRIEDMVAGIATPGANERLQFARQVVQHKGIDPTTAAGKNQVRRFLSDALERSLADTQDYLRIRQPVDALRLFRDRGLSSDTTVLPDFGIEQALEALRSRGMLGAGRVRRVAIIGPGLDFSDRREGYDFYPQQTIQPFAVIDSLIRLGLAKPNDLRMTTFDLSPRVNQHLEAARERARAGRAYVLQLPRDAEWTPELMTYWKRFGDRIGQDVEPVAAPAGVGSIQVRAVRVRPEVVMSTSPQDLNIVLQRLEPLAADERFDLIVATNILLYYDVFEQWLALANVAKMLRSGGFFLSNNPVFELSITPIRGVGWTDVVYYTDRQRPGDRLLWYQRQ